jgi:hypothetical protein
VREEEGVDENVGKFFANLGRIGRLGILPQKALKKFAGFDGKAGSKVFRVMKLGPISSVAEGEGFILEVG